MVALIIHTLRTHGQYAKHSVNNIQIYAYVIENVVRQQLLCVTITQKIVLNVLSKVKIYSIYHLAWTENFLKLNKRIATEKPK